MAMYRDMTKFRSTTWDDVSDGDTVFIRGSHDGSPAAYGPHTVASADERKLTNKKGTFMHFSESLMIRKEGTNVGPGNDQGDEPRAGSEGQEEEA